MTLRNRTNLIIFSGVLIFTIGGLLWLAVLRPIVFANADNTTGTSVSSPTDTNSETNVGSESPDPPVESPSASQDTFDDSIPSPELTPKEVVEIQLESLRGMQNDPAELIACYSLASPLNRESSGPFGRFQGMMEEPPFDELVFHKRWQIREPEINEDKAIVLVSLITLDDRAVLFQFSLTKQTAEPYVGCWMTDAVSFEGMGRLPNN